MSNRQYIRKEEKHYIGKENSYVSKTEEHSAFLNDGNIITRLKTEQPVAQGITPHKQIDIVGECQNCFQFITKEMYSKCQLCMKVCCLPCSIKNQNMTVCPICSELLNQHRLRLMLRRFFIEPFIEWLK